MTNFIIKFLTKLSRLTKPLWELIKKNVEFHWLEIHEQAFLALKNLITQSETGLLWRFESRDSPRRRVESQPWSSSDSHRPIAFTFKAMNMCCYAQIEKELLAVVFACKRFHQYVFGKPIIIVSDHKPLDSIFRKPLLQAPDLKDQSCVHESYRNVRCRCIVMCLSTWHYWQAVWTTYCCGTFYPLNVFRIPRNRPQTQSSPRGDQIQWHYATTHPANPVWLARTTLLHMWLCPDCPYRDKRTTQNNLIFKAQIILTASNFRADEIGQTCQK